MTMMEDLSEVVRLGVLADNTEGRLAAANAYSAESEIAANFIRTHHATITDMAKRLEAAERDAARYRHLRKEGDIGCVINGVIWMTFDELDAAIDAAMQESGE